MKFCKFLDAVQLFSLMTDDATFLPGNTIEIIQIKFIATHANSSVGKYYLYGQSVKKPTNISNSEVVVDESKEVR